MKQVEQSWPEELAPTTSAMTETVRSAGEWATATKNRRAVAVGTTCLAVALLVLLFKRDRND
jgi:hypothetical protein